MKSYKDITPSCFGKYLGGNIQAERDCNDCEHINVCVSISKVFDILESKLKSQKGRKDIENRYKVDSRGKK